MPTLEGEIKGNFNKFKTKWKSELLAIQGSLAARDQAFLDSYTRLTSINAWRELLIKNEVSEKA